MELLIATHNQGKVREVREALAPLQITLRSLAEFPGVTTVAETGNTYLDNATLKAVGYATQTGLLALADDSGLEVDALGGQPGVYSARFGGDAATDSDRVDKLLNLLSSHSGNERTAHFVCCMVLAKPPSASTANVVTSVEERCEGLLSSSPRGVNGFGYDPIFVPAGYSATFGELDAKIKENISHRGKALKAVRTFLQDWLNNLTVS